MRRALTVLIGLICLVASGCSSPGTATHDSQQTIYEYTCCTAKDMNTVYRPGQTLVLHWIAVARSDGSVKSTAPVTLTAKLNGPFHSVSEAKSRPSAGGSLASTPRHISEYTGGSPTSEILIPATTMSGYFNLTTRVEGNGNMVAATGTIRVDAGR